MTFVTADSGPVRVELKIGDSYYNWENGDGLDLIGNNKLDLIPVSLDEYTIELSNGY